MRLRGKHASVLQTWGGKETSGTLESHVQQQSTGTEHELVKCALPSSSSASNKYMFVTI